MMVVTTKVIYDDDENDDGGAGAGPGASVADYDDGDGSRSGKMPSRMWCHFCAKGINVDGGLLIVALPTVY